MRTIILGCEKDHISIRVRDVDTQKVSTYKAKNQEDIKYIFEKIKLNDDHDVVMCSSSMDFPQEYTTRKSIIRLAHKIRSE